MNSNKRQICQAVIFALSAMAASAAMATTVPPLVGGGSSLVAPSIAQEITAFGTSTGKISYFSVGSGAGQTAFLTNNTAGFGSGIAGPVDFANSDAGLTSAQVSGYTLASADGPLIQIPYLTTPITIPYVSGPTGAVALNDSDLCGVFSGKLTNWNQLTNPSTGSLYTNNLPFKVVYRSDNSGTTDLLTRHLAAVCSSSTSAITFTETQSLASLFTTVPSNFIAESGSGGVANELVSLRTANTPAISYLSPDYTNTTLAPQSPNAQANNLTVAGLFNTHTGAVVQPLAARASTAVGTVSAPTGTAAANPLNWVPNSADPTVGYPISGTSQIIVSQCYANPSSQYSPSPAAALVSFLNNHYTNSTFTSILAGNGFAVVPASFQTAILADFLSNSSGNNLDIGNASVCGAVTGR